MNGGFDRHFPERTARVAPASASKRLRPALLCAMFTEDVWEEYAMGMRSEEDCKLLEEHLLICSACQDLLAEADKYIPVAKAAVALATAEDTGDRSLFTDIRMRMHLSKPVKAAATLAGGLLWLS